MIVGTDFANSGGKTYFGFSSSYSQFLTQHYSTVRQHDLPRREEKTTERKSKDEKENIITEARTKIMVSNIIEALKKHEIKNKGLLPEQIVIYRDGLGGPTFQQKALAIEVPAVA
jgi:hypothetical protein